MTDTPQPTPTPPRTESKQDARLKREADALRENLRRRKQQSRARAEPIKPGST